VGDEFTPANLALAMMGKVTQSAAQVATPVTGETLTTSAIKGGFYKTAKLGPITAVTVNQSGTPLVAGVDYTVHNPEVGIIHILPTSATVTNGSTLTVSYTPTAYAAGLQVVAGGTDMVIEGAVMFVPDPTTGPKLLLEVWDVSVTPEGALGLISEDFAQLSLTMAIQADAMNHPNEPLYRITYLE
jgi:hypothetical protein